MKIKLTAVLLSGLLFAVPRLAVAADQEAFLGGWALYPPGGGAGWLGVNKNADAIQAEMMWIGGSVVPLDTVLVRDGKLRLTRSRELAGPLVEGKPSKRKVIEAITVTLDGTLLNCVSVTPKPDGQGEDRFEFTGKRLPPLPPAPDLSKVRFGVPIQLFTGRDLDGWRLTYTNADNGWSVRDGVLVCDPKQEEGKPPKHYGNLRTVAEFEDFSLHAETRLAKDGNSGIYLRGIYEVQVYDSFGRPLDSHNMGALYSRITPSSSAEKHAGEWQTLDITLVDRHVTVVLNGQLIIANQPVPGPTGGALWSEVDRPGPIYLQGDHTGIEYRHLVMRPVIGR